MKPNLLMKVGLSLAVMFSFCSVAMAADGETATANASETLRQSHTEALTYHEVGTDYTPGAGDVAFYDINQDGISDGHGVICVAGDIPVIGGLTFDAPGAARKPWAQLQDCVMGYGESSQTNEAQYIPAAPNFAFI